MPNQDSQTMAPNAGAPLTPNATLMNNSSLQQPLNSLRAQRDVGLIGLHSPAFTERKVTCPDSRSPQFSTREQLALSREQVLTSSVRIVWGGLTGGNVA